MVAETFADFAQRNLSRYPVHLTVACIGGVAAAFEKSVKLPIFLYSGALY